MASPSEIGEVVRLLKDFDLEVRRRGIGPCAQRIGLKIALALNEVWLAASGLSLDKVEAEIKPIVEWFLLGCEEGGEDG